MNSNTRNGLIAAGLAAVAYWFKGMTPEQRQNVKDKVAGAGKRFTEKANEAMNSAKSTINKTSGDVREETTY